MDNEKLQVTMEIATLCGALLRLTYHAWVAGIYTHEEHTRIMDKLAPTLGLLTHMVEEITCQTSGS